MSRSSIEEALRVMKHVENMPALRKVIEEKGIQSVRPVAAIATPETADFWAEKARIMGKHTLETYVREYRKEFLPGEATQPEKGATGIGPSSPTPPVKIKTLNMDLSPDVAAELEKLKGKGDWNTLMKELLQLRKEKLDRPAAPAKGRILHFFSLLSPCKLGYSKKRGGDTSLRFVSTRGQCAYPGCTKPYEILHHTQRFSLKNVHDPDHLVPLCEAHEHLAHHGLIANEDQSPGKWQLLLEPTWYDFKQVIDKNVAGHRNP